MILETQKNQPDQTGDGQMTPNDQALILEQGRKQISSMTGREIKGDEKVADLFSGAISDRINNFITPNLGGDGSFPILPIIMAFFLFLSVVSLGSFLSPLWILLASLLFKALVKAKVVTVNKVMKEVEVLE
jgi:hypothetical protein